MPDNGARYRDYIEFAANVTRGVLGLDRASLKAALHRLADGDYVLTLEKAHPRKSRQQEKGFHAMITPWAREEGHAIEDLKRDLLREIFGLREHVNRFTGEVELVLREPHTSTLTRKQYSTLIERTLEIAASCGVILIPPDEWKATRRRRETRATTEAA